jgi:hypothetical protein
MNMTPVHAGSCIVSRALDHGCGFCLVGVLFARALDMCVLRLNKLV